MWTLMLFLWNQWPEGSDCYGGDPRTMIHAFIRIPINWADSHLLNACYTRVLENSSLTKGDKWLIHKQMLSRVININQNTKRTVAGEQFILPRHRRVRRHPADSEEGWQYCLFNEMCLWRKTWQKCEIMSKSRPQKELVSLGNGR